MKIGEIRWNLAKIGELWRNLLKFGGNCFVFKFGEILKLEVDWGADLTCIHYMKVGSRLRSWPSMCSLHEGWIKTEELTYHVFTPWRLDQDWGLVVEVVVFIVVVHFHQISPKYTKFLQTLKNHPKLRANVRSHES